ncbi:flagellar basal body L-ring protein FlgH [Pseudaminobacter arsenicus]|uniref:Flagellar L-ring protein n=1 Tax=Borborobacter arsenicus TaxID=1851146 RepID=A0A432V636_9HYPH|nr:flagellar basal body L-ring protein FlgH [Pseudaminobacter arsenicus]RUM97543.1 flagellar basal body L-ring protein FlgH [Pseudaminobacter arsenicus]
MIRFAVLALAVITVSGCATRTDEIGREPSLSPVGSGIAQQSVYQYPQQPAQPVKRFSLWDDRQKRLFTDPRALAPGDILTVQIEINDRARFKNESERDRKVGRSLGLGMDFGWDSVTHGGSFDADIDSDTSTKGAGKTERSETIELQVAAVVSDVLPNGNLVINGSQEVRVNFELRVLTIAGIVRPIDIGPNNTISYERIAEARISYGGRGRLTEVQQPPYGQQILDNVLPF